MAKKGVLIFFVCLLYLVMLALGVVLAFEEVYNLVIPQIIDNPDFLKKSGGLFEIVGLYLLMYVPTVLLFIGTDEDKIALNKGGFIMGLLCVALQIAICVYFYVTVEMPLVIKIVLPIYMAILDFTIGAFAEMNTVVRTILIPILPIIHAPIAPIMFFVDIGVTSARSSNGSSSSSSSKSSSSSSGSYYGGSSSSSSSSGGGGIQISDEYGNTLTLTYYGTVWIYGPVNTEHPCYRDNLGNFWISDDGGRSFYRKPTLNCSF